MLPILALTALCLAATAGTVSAIPALKPLPAYTAPEAVYENDISDPSFAASNPLAARDSNGHFDVESIAAHFVSSRHKNRKSKQFKFVVKDSHRTGHNGISHLYLQEFVNNLPIANLISNVNIAADGSVISAGTRSSRPHAAVKKPPQTQESSFVAPANNQVDNDDDDDDSTTPQAPTPEEAKLDEVDAILSFTTAIGLTNVSKKDLTYDAEKGVVKGASFALSDIPVVKKYYYTADKQIRLIYDFNVEQEEQW
jgi:hypothetical protein